jgi:uncharacterized membrane protein
MNDAFQQAAHAVQTQKQRKRAAGLRTGFRIHLAVFVMVQLLLLAIWLSTGADFPWPLFVLLGWGAGVAAHGLALRAAARSAA